MPGVLMLPPRRWEGGVTVGALARYPMHPPLPAIMLGRAPLLPWAIQ